MSKGLPVSGRSRYLHAGENEEGRALLATLKLIVVKGGAGMQIGRYASLPGTCVGLQATARPGHACSSSIAAGASSCWHLHPAQVFEATALPCRNKDLTLILAPTPRWPDLMCAYSRPHRIMFTSKLFCAHVSQVNFEILSARCLRACPSWCLV